MSWHAGSLQRLGGSQNNEIGLVRGEVAGVDGLVAVLQDASVFPTVSLQLVKTLVGPIHLNDEQKRRILQACERRLNEDEAPTRSSVVRQLRELLAPSSAVAAS